MARRQGGLTDPHDTGLRRDRRRWLSAACALAVTGACCTAAQVRAQAQAKGKVRTIHVVARKFEFVPGEIRVKPGETVQLSFTAPEVPMGASFPDFGLRTDVVPGRTATLLLTAGKAGRFTFLCDVFCGSGHEDMSGVLVVEG